MESPHLMLDKLLMAAVSRKASDLHLAVGTQPSLRVRGEMVRIDKTPVLSAEDTVKLSNQFLTDTDRVKLDQDGTVDFSREFKDGVVFRFNVTKEVKGRALVARLLPSEIFLPEDLGLSKPVVDLMRRPTGLVLVTGATGSGKSTTLASLMQWYADNFARKVVTVEQPIEYRLKHGKSVVVQYEVPNHLVSFIKALGSMLRQDPNLIMVGELRDLETIEMALHAAETGHLVLTTLHTNSAADSIDRIVNVFPASKESEVRTVLSSCLLGVISQCLLRRADGNGRVMAYELLLANSALGNLIRKGQTAQIESIIQTGGRSMGMQLLDDHLLALVDQGVVTRGDALAKARNPAALVKRLPRAASGE